MKKIRVISNLNKNNNQLSFESKEVTIIISAYGLGNLLQGTLESVYRQTFKNWKLILIADCCQSEFFKELGTIDQRVEIINLPIHCGNQYGPNSFGIRITNSKYLAFLNQDDLWLEDHLERSIYELETKELDSYFARSAFCHLKNQSSWPGGDDFLQFSEYNQPNLYWRSLFGPNYYFEPVSSWVVRTEVAKKVGDWISPDKTILTPLMDWFSRLIRESNKFGFGEVLTVLKINLRNNHFEEKKKPIYFRKSIGKEKLLELIDENKTKIRSIIKQQVMTAKEKGLLVREEPKDDLEEKRKEIFVEFLHNKSINQFKKEFKNLFLSEGQVATFLAATHIRRTGQFLNKYPSIEQVNKFFLILSDIKNDLIYLKSSIRPTTLSACKDWLLTKSNLEHKTKRYFSIEIVESCGIEHIYINQPEVGILGIVIVSDGPEKKWLLQIKPEPGNVGIVQFAPTVQATKSNYERVHNGKNTQYLDIFFDNKDKLLTDVYGSEQGDRFINKFNRNIKINLIDKEKNFQLKNQFKFFNREEIKIMLGMDYLLNTDARSVIASGSWEILSECREKMFLGCSYSLLNLDKALNVSMQKKSSRNLERARALLKSMFCYHSVSTKIVPWSQSKIFTLTENGIYRRGGEKVVGFYNCILPSREIGEWQQPLLEKDNVALYWVPIKIIDGVAMLGVRAKKEIGFLGRAEFSVVIHQEYPNFKELKLAMLDKDKFGDILLSIRQSDEGGRFWKNESLYCISVIKGHEKVYANLDINWLTLADLEELTVHKGLVSNELRTIISLLLSLA